MLVRTFFLRARLLACIDFPIHIYAGDSHNKLHTKEVNSVFFSFPLPGPSALDK